MTAGRFDVVVIGGGANGLTAAAVLGKAGLRVVLVEGAEALGGQGRVVEFAPGFRAAPLATDPGWLPPSVARALGLESLERFVGASLSVVVEPGTWLTLSEIAWNTAVDLRKHSATDAAKWPTFTTRLRRLAGFLEKLYQRPALDIETRSWADLPDLLSFGREFRALGRTDMIELLRTLPMSVWELLEDWFECEPLKAAVAAGGVVDHAQGPRSGGTGFILLHHLTGAPDGSVRGRVPWMGGPGAFTEAAAAAARRVGVTVRTGAAVTRILVRDDAVAGVVLEGGEEIAASRVLSTADPARTLLEWVDAAWLDPEFMHAVRNIRYRGCTAFVLYALDALPTIPGLVPEAAFDGVLSLTPSLVALEKAADAAKYGTVSESPHVELTFPNRMWLGLSPAGQHVMVARVQYAPYRLRDGAAWDVARREVLADVVTRAVESVSPGFASRVLHRAAWSPQDLAERFGLREGAVSHGELGLDQILFMRPVPGWGRHTTPIAGLYLGGAGTHPGPGILGGPGWLAARRLLADRGRRNGGA
jgi:phytoene dehydrogenase-like protein